MAPYRGKMLLSGNNAGSAKLNGRHLESGMPRSDCVFPLKTVLAVSLLATVSGLAAERVWRLQSTLAVGPLVGASAVWPATART
jgi:hypothetical protein